MRCPARLRFRGTMNNARIGDLVMEAMEHVQERYGEDATLGEVCIVMDVMHEGWSVITYHCSDPRPWVQEALLANACEVAEVNNTPAAVEDEDE